MRNFRTFQYFRTNLKKSAIFGLLDTLVLRFMVRHFPSNPPPTKKCKKTEVEQRRCGELGCIGRGQGSSAWSRHGRRNGYRRAHFRQNLRRSESESGSGKRRRRGDRNRETAIRGRRRGLATLALGLLAPPASSRRAAPRRAADKTELHMDRGSATQAQLHH